MSTDTRTTGLDLKVERIRAGLLVKDVAAQMGISPSRLSRIEVDEPVTDRMLGRYRDALDRCRTSSTPAGATSAA